MSSGFDINCSACPRLSQFLAVNRQQYPNYYNLPVPSFGVAQPRLLIIGLAPGLHGANATGLPFIGDSSGTLLFQTLFKFGFSTSKNADESLQLIDCRISNAVKCLPPQNKPLLDEIKRCNGFLLNEISSLAKGSVLIALGSVAHDAVIRALGLIRKDYRFAHNVVHNLAEHQLTLIDSYHCSRYNTQTKRLTPEMFEAVFANARGLLA